VEPGRKSAPCREANAIVGTGTGTGVGTGVSDVTIGIRWRGRVRLDGHDPSKRRKGRVGILADGQVPVLFVHADVGWGNERELKWEGKGDGGKEN
jgi:hypothetical protein